MRTGTRRAAENAEAWWWQQACAAVHALAATGRPFDVSDVRAYLQDVEPDDPRRWGALFAWHARRGRLEVVDYRLDKTTGRPCRVWRGVPAGEDE